MDDIKNHDDINHDIIIKDHEIGPPSQRVNLLFRQEELRLLSHIINQLNP